MQKKPLSLFQRYPLPSMLIDLLLMTSLVTLIIGITAPLLTLEKLYFFESRVSLISAVMQLLQKQEWVLFIIIGLFSLCLPFIKILSLVTILHIPHLRKSFLGHLLHWIERLGKWSMLEVFVVALLLVSVKLGALAKVTVHYGVYTFATSVILTMLASFWIEQLSEKNRSIDISA